MQIDSQSPSRHIQAALRCWVVVSSLAGLGCGGRMKPAELDHPASCIQSGLRACQTACQEGDGEACLAASTAVRRDPAAMMVLEERACTLGSAQGCTYYGNNFSLEPKVDLAKARVYWARGCDGGSVKACWAISWHAMHAVDPTSRVIPDPVQARAALEQACALDPKSCGALAVLEDAGLGGPEDRTAASSHHAVACQAGHRTACLNEKSALDTIWLGAHDSAVLQMLSTPKPRFDFEGGDPEYGRTSSGAIGVCFRSDSTAPFRAVVVRPSGSGAVDAGMLAAVGLWRAHIRSPFPSDKVACSLVVFDVEREPQKAVVRPMPSMRL